MKYIQTKKWIGLCLDQKRTSHRSHPDDGLCMKEKAQIWARLQSVTMREEGVRASYQRTQKVCALLCWYICIQADPLCRLLPDCSQNDTSQICSMETSKDWLVSLEEESCQRKVNYGHWCWELMVRCITQVLKGARVGEKSKRESEREVKREEDAFINCVPECCVTWIRCAKWWPGCEYSRRCVMRVTGATHSDKRGRRGSQRERALIPHPTASLLSTAKLN